MATLLKKKKVTKEKVYKLDMCHKCKNTVFHLYSNKGRVNAICKECGSEMMVYTKVPQDTDRWVIMNIREFKKHTTILWWDEGMKKWVSAPNGSVFTTERAMNLLLPSEGTWCMFPRLDRRSN